MTQENLTKHEEMLREAMALFKSQMISSYYAIWLVMRCYDSYNVSLGHEPGLVDIRLETIQGILGFSRVTAIKSINRLGKMGLVTREKATVNHKPVNVYRLNYRPDYPSLYSKQDFVKSSPIDGAGNGILVKVGEQLYAEQGVSRKCASFDTSSVCSDVNDTLSCTQNYSQNHDTKNLLDNGLIIDTTVCQDRTVGEKEQSVTYSDRYMVDANLVEGNLAIKTELPPMAAEFMTGENERPYAADSRLRGNFYPFPFSKDEQLQAVWQCVMENSENYEIKQGILSAEVWSGTKFTESVNHSRNLSWYSYSFRHVKDSINGNFKLFAQYIGYKDMKSFMLDWFPRVTRKTIQLVEGTKVFWKYVKSSTMDLFDNAKQDITRAANNVVNTVVEAVTEKVYGERKLNGFLPKLAGNLDKIDEVLIERSIPVEIIESRKQDNVDSIKYVDNPEELGKVIGGYVNYKLNEFQQKDCLAFPLYDHNGDVRNFTFKIDKHYMSPKNFLRTRHKVPLHYGDPTIAGRKQVIVCEGAMDTIVMQSIARTVFGDSVAVIGAIDAGQMGNSLELLKDCEVVSVVYDMDGKKDKKDPGYIGQRKAKELVRSLRRAGIDAREIDWQYIVDRIQNIGDVHLKDLNDFVVAMNNDWMSYQEICDMIIDGINESFEGEYMERFIFPRSNGYEK